MQILNEQEMDLFWSFISRSIERANLRTDTRQIMVAYTPGCWATHKVKY